MVTEKRLIDALPLMRNGWILLKTGKSNRVLSSMSLADVPAVDAEEVVRCKDCKYCERDHTLDCGGDEYYYCWNYAMEHGQARANDFCSYGERKDNGQ